jgi:hypothetical protein
MRGKVKVFHLIILDESGSMFSIREFILDAFNNLVLDTKSIAAKYPEQEHFVTLVTFNTLGIRTYLYNAPLKEFEIITGQNYMPNSGTPLYDAMGHSIGKLKNDLQNASEYNVLVNIFTDGLENASREYSGIDIRNLINDLKKTGKWTFTYTGADHDVEEMAKSMSISNHSYFVKSSTGIAEMVQREHRARNRLFQKLSSKQSLTDDYYKDSEE